jgi:antitoxin component of MazEF toxin-antitoxin module
MSIAKRDPATLQTASGMPVIKVMNESLTVSPKEKDRLQELGKRVAEIAALPVQAEKASLWQRHNDLETQEPVVFIDPENGWNECIPAESLQCTTPIARVWEMFLRKQIYWFEVLKDDKVIEPYFDVPYSYSDTGWGLDLKREHGGGGGSFIIVPAVEDYDDDLPGLRFPKIIIDQAESDAVLALAHEVFDGILTVRRKTVWWWSMGMTRNFIDIRGLENFLCDLIAEPENVHKLMDLLCEGWLGRIDDLEQGGYLCSNADGTYVGSGGFGFTKNLAKPGGKVTAMDMWGLVESQETVAVSPAMYGEFILPYHIKIAERFGLNCYGCCEGFDKRWEYVKTIPRLRRVSVSPWSDWSTLPGLLGKNYIASVKPGPTPLALSVLDEDAACADLRKAVGAVKDCVVEIIMKDNHTLGGNPRNAARWVELARQAVAGV